jgi:hypothetical protein
VFELSVQPFCSQGAPTGALIPSNRCLHDACEVQGAISGIWAWAMCFHCLMLRPSCCVLCLMIIGVVGGGAG